MPGCALAELVEHPIAVRLLHFRVDVEARVPDFSNFLGEELNPINGVAENDRLVDFQLEVFEGRRSSEGRG